MNWLECVERRSALAGEDVRFSLSQVEWDFNCDGIFTINDLWEGLKWLVHIPGDMLVSWIDSPRVIEFLELGGTPYGTHFSTLLGWPLSIAVVIYTLIMILRFIESVINIILEVKEVLQEIFDWINKNIFLK